MREELFGNFKKTLKRTADTMSKKTDEFVEMQKLRSRKHAIEDSIKDTYAEIGKKIYARYKAEQSCNKEVSDLCDVITRLEEDLAACNEEIAMRKGETECPNCGAANPKSSVFCMNCGSRLEEPASAPVFDMDPVQDVEEKCEEETDSEE